jgi:hypothetical protein
MGDYFAALMESSMKRTVAINALLALALSGCGSRVDTAPSGTRASEPSADAPEQQSEKPSEGAKEQSDTPTYQTVKTNDDGSTVVTYLSTTMVPETMIRKTATGDEETHTTYVEQKKEESCTVPAGEDIEAFIRQRQKKAAQKPQ